MNPLRLVFMGTPAFSVPVFSKLLVEGYQIVALYTQPDRQTGRGRRFFSTPAKQAAQEHGVPVLQPASLRDDPSVIDELASESAYDPIAAAGLLSRRVVEMNSAGFVMVDRTWSFEEDASGLLIAQLGQAERYKHDCKGRVIQRRSAGWSVANSQNPPTGTTEGLIQVFEYEDPCCNWDPVLDDCGCNPTPPAQPPCLNIPIHGQTTHFDPPGEIIAEGVVQGTDGIGNGAIEWLRYVVRHPDRPELVTREIAFTEPVLALPADPFPQPVPDGWSVTDTVYAFDNTRPGISAADWPIQSKAVIRPPVARTPAGTEYYAVSKQRYDDKGNVEWAGAGSLSNPSSINTAVEFFVSYADRDDVGRIKLQVADADPLGSNRHPCGIQRHRLGRAQHFL